MKYCPSCGCYRPADAFYRNPSHRDGLSTRCKSCSSARAGALYHARPKLPVIPLRPARRTPPPPLPF